MICLTERLYVRQFEMTDLDVFAVLCADAVVLRYVGDGTPLARSEVANWIQICEQKYATRGYGTSAVFTRSDDRFIGYCGVVRAPNNDFDELVYVFHSAVWGQGFATEAATAMLDYVFSMSALADIYATIDPLNTASIGVVKKLGFEYDREEMDDLGPVAFYRLSRIQWLRLRV